MTNLADTAGMRICSPEQTLERIRPAFQTAGITRIANITGLDRIGLPVAAAIRPNSPTLSTSAGKGLTPVQAKVSAAMEALELFCVENLKPAFVKRSLTQMTAHHAPLLNLETMLRPHVSFDRDWPRDWVAGRDLVAGDPVAVPLRLVNLCVPENAYDIQAFQTSSNGLASGNCESEAVLAGLLELVERDAVTCFEHRWRGLVPPRLMLEAGVSPVLLEVFDRVRAAEIRVVLEDCTSDLGIPVVRARLFDEAFPSLGVYHGQAAHPVAATAALKALLEAVQSRAVYIAGSRDDCFHEELRLLRKARFTEAAMDARGACPDVSLPPDSSNATGLEDDIASICAALRRSGLQQIVVVNVSHPVIPIHAAKVIVPGLEAYLNHHYRAARIAERICA